MKKTLLEYIFTQDRFAAMMLGKQDYIQHSLECSDLERVTIEIDPNIYSLEDHVGEDQPEQDLYFYHSDHLGSSSFITVASGNAIQLPIAIGIQYMPYGAPKAFGVVDQRLSNWNTPYTFSGKEKDEETGYSYFGARYLAYRQAGYDSDLSLWLSVDPLADKYPGTSPYMYVRGNPVMLVDPDGRKFKTAQDLERAKKSQEAVRNKKAEYQSEIDKLKSKENLTDDEAAQLKNYQSMSDEMDAHDKRIQDMIDDQEWTFSYEKGGDGTEGYTEYRDGIVYIQYWDDMPNKQAHEEVHGHQYITGEIKIGKSTSLEAEAAAYRIDYALREATGKNSRAQFIEVLEVPEVKGIDDITAANLAKSPVIQHYYKNAVKEYKKKTKKSKYVKNFNFTDFHIASIINLSFRMFNKYYVTC